MSDSRDYRGQYWFIDCMNNLGYNFSRKGKCFGMALMGIQAVQSQGDGLDVYNTRVDAIRETYLGLSAKAKAKALDEFKNNLPAGADLKDIKDETVRQNVVNRIHDIFKEEVAKLKNPNLNVYDLYGLFDGIEVYQRRHDYKNQLGDSGEKRQDAMQSQKLVMSEAIEKKGGLAEILTMSGCYSDKELETYFGKLGKALEGVTYPVSLQLGSYRHGVAVNYIPPQKPGENPSWVYINANNLPPINIKANDLKELAKHVKEGFRIDKSAPQDRPTIIETHVFSTKDNAAALRPRIIGWRRDPEMSRIQMVTAEKISARDNLNDSWLLIAARLKEKSFQDEKPKTLFAASPVGYYYLKRSGLVEGSISQKSIEDLIKNKKVDPDSKDFNGNSLVHFAVSENSSKLLKALINQNANLKLQNQEGLTALHLAAAKGHLPTLGLLIKKDPSVLQIKDNNGESPFDKASPIVVEFMMAQTGKDNLKVQFWDAVQNGNDRVAAILVNKNPALIHGNEGVKALSIAVDNGQLAIAELLLNKGVSPVAMDMTTGNMAIHVAAAAANEKMLDLLMKSAPNPNVVNVSRETPLMLAIKNGHVDAALKMLKNGADVNSKDANGNTVLHALSKASQNSSVMNSDKWKKMIAHILNKADKTQLNEKDNSGKPPLYYALEAGNDRLAISLIKAGADFNAQVDNRPLFCMLVDPKSKFEIKSVMQKLQMESMLSMVDFNHGDNLKEFCKAAIEHDRKNMIGLIVKAGIVEFHNPVLLDHLSKASKEDKKELLKEMVANVSYNKKDAQGNTPVMAAMLNKVNPEYIQAMLATGKVDFSVKNNQGQALMDVAKQCGYEKVFAQPSAEQAAPAVARTAARSVVYRAPERTKEEPFSRPKQMAVEDEKLEEPRENIFTGPRNR